MWQPQTKVDETPQDGQNGAEGGPARIFGWLPWVGKKPASGLEQAYDRFLETVKDVLSDFTTMEVNSVLVRNISADHPSGPRFRCELHPDVMRQLRNNPALVFATPKPSKTFWLRTLVHSILTGGQVIFETALPPRGEDASSEVAIRSLFQFGGDVVVSIDERFLTRADGREILEAHTRWTGWCLTQLAQALALPSIVRRLGWFCLIAGPLCFVAGVFRYGGILQPLGILLSMPGHLLLPPARQRFFCWLPVMLGTIMGIMPGAVTSLPTMGLWQVSMVALFQGGLWRPVG